MDLDNLTNDQIRIQLVQHGFANLPVTQTTRKVLLKKLRKVIDGQEGKIRRETIAVSKFSSDEDPDKEEAAGRKVKAVKAVSRRATIAPGEKVRKAATSTTNISTFEEPAKPRSRDILVNEKAFITSTVTAPFIQEDTDDDVIEVPVRRSSMPRAGSSRTSTPTLGKSEVVRTSYKTGTADENTAEEIDEPAEIEVSEPIRKSPVSSAVHRKTITTSSSTYTSKFSENPSTSFNFGRASLTTSYNPSANAYKFTGDDEDNNDLELNETNTPYLSNFAKRLSTLRAEPLDIGPKKYKISSAHEIPSTDYRPRATFEHRYDYSPIESSKKNVQAPPRHLAKDLLQMLDSLDRKYNIRTTLAIIFIIFVIVAIIVIII